MNGLHLIADLHHCQCPQTLLLDAVGLQTYCINICQRHGLNVVGQLFHPFIDAQGQGAGVTGTVVLAESHLAIHTWPEIMGVTLDVYVCNFSGDNSKKAHALFEEIINTFMPSKLATQEIKRGHR